jgi:transcription antitermination protein NusB
MASTETGPSEARRHARALQLLYAWESQGRPPLEEVVAGLARLTGPESALLDGGDQLAQGTVRQLEEIDRHIAAAVEHWRFDRIGLLERLLLRLGVHDLLQGTVPPRLAIDTTLWLVRRYVGPAAVPFVNGVLDRVAHDLGRL